MGLLSRLETPTGTKGGSFVPVGVSNRDKRLRGPFVPVGATNRDKRPLLVFYNVTNKIRKCTDTAVAFTQEYSRVSYPQGNVSTLSTGSDSPSTHTLV